MPITKRIPIEEAELVVTGLARDCGKSLRPSIDALKKAAAGFRSVRFLIVESDSTDDTGTQLAAMEKPGSFDLLRLGSLQPAMPDRTARLAHCRNIARDWIAEHCGGADYVLVADLDGVNEGVERAALESGWVRAEPWSVLCANQPGPYYDVWALRHPYWSPDDCWQAARALEPAFGRTAARNLCIRARQLTLPPTSAPVEVDSAFGGLAVYSLDAFFAGRYAGALDGVAICEHVPFHAALRMAGHRIFIEPRLLNACQEEHTRAHSLLGQLASGIRRRLRL